MLGEVDKFAQEFLVAAQDKKIRIISHFDTDGITSAAILVKTFQRLDLKFTLNVVRGLDADILKMELLRQPDEVLIFVDLASGSLEYFQDLRAPIFILDHHEIEKSKLNDNVRIVNNHLTDDVEGNSCTGAGLAYLFSKAISPDNLDLSSLAIIGLIGDRHDSHLSKINQLIINDTKDLTIKKGLTLYPATRPLKRTLEYSTSPYIPGVTGNGEGVIELLRETGIALQKNLLELSEDEMSRLLTAITLRRTQNGNSDDIVGNLFILKFFDTQEDVREISTLINACSRLGHHDIALLYCLQNKSAKARALSIYTEYKQELVSGLKIAENMNKIRGDNFVILNAKDTIKDAIIGTICSMLSSSSLYEDGTILIGMAYNGESIKVSARQVGENGRNLKELMENTVVEFRDKNPESVAEVGGHYHAAGCFFPKDKEESFLEILKKNLEIEVVKV